MENTELKQGDRVSFCIEGNNTEPFGHGTVIFASKTKTLIQPDAQMSVGMVMRDIKKVS